MNEQPRELVRVNDPEYQGLRMAVAPAEAGRRMQELQAFVAEAMIGDVDFGIIPGTQKPTLYQPGAQKLCEMYGLAAEFVFDSKVAEWDRSFFYYEVRAVLTDRRTGAFVGMGIGSCNSKEKRYAGRWANEADVPAWLDKKILRRREATQWIYKSQLPPGTDPAKLPTQNRNKKDGSGTYTVYGLDGQQYFCPNEDIFDLVNTFQKMACKRALVHAVLQVTRSAGVFSQDLEDLSPDALGTVAGRRSWERDDEPEERAAPTMTTAKKAPPTEPDWLAKLAACTSKADVNGIAEAMRKIYGEDNVPEKWRKAAISRHSEFNIAPANGGGHAKPAPVTTPPPPEAPPIACPKGCGDSFLPEFMDMHLRGCTAKPKPCDGDHADPICGSGCYLAPPPVDGGGAA